MTPIQVVGGAPFSYMMEVTNVSNLPLDSVVVKETPPSNFRMTGSNPKNTMAGGEMVSPSVRSARVSPRPSRSWLRHRRQRHHRQLHRGRLQVGRLLLDRRREAGHQGHVTGPAEVTTCDDICYTYTVTNSGTGAASNVVVRGNLPNGMTADGKSTFSKNVGTCAAVRARTSRSASKPARAPTKWVVPPAPTEAYTPKPTRSTRPSSSRC